MGNSIPFRCPMDGCKFNKHILYADQFQIKWHIKNGHGYGELIETSVQYDIIRDETERRNPDWLTERLAEFVIKGIKNETHLS